MARTANPNIPHDLIDTITGHRTLCAQPFAECLRLSQLANAGYRPLRFIIFESGLIPDGFRPLRRDEPLRVGVHVINHEPELDSDEHDKERTTPPGTRGELRDLNHGDTWDLVFPSNGAWVCPTEAELRDPAQYTLYVAIGT